MKDEALLDIGRKRTRATEENVL